MDGSWFVLVERAGTVEGQCVSLRTMMDGGWGVKLGLVRVCMAPLVRCRRSPQQFQKTMVDVLLLAMAGGAGSVRCLKW
jgi:hypothetical protein